MQHRQMLEYSSHSVFLSHRKRNNTLSKFSSIFPESSPINWSILLPTTYTLTCSVQLPIFSAKYPQNRRIYGVTFNRSDTISFLPCCTQILNWNEGTKKRKSFRRSNTIPLHLIGQHIYQFLPSNTVTMQTTYCTLYTSKLKITIKTSCNLSLQCRVRVPSWSVTGERTPPRETVTRSQGAQVFSFAKDITSR